MRRINFVNVLSPLYALKVEQADEAVRVAEVLRERALQQQRHVEDIARRIDAVATLNDLLRTVSPE